ncbi:MAG: hypothetical protein KAI83_07045 [Thiomargarita sp.]|nr:hypothetical protein [Thiomargarita sp.]
MSVKLLRLSKSNLSPDTETWGMFQVKVAYSLSKFEAIFNILLIYHIIL